LIGNLVAARDQVEWLQGRRRSLRGGMDNDNNMGQNNGNNTGINFEQNNQQNLNFFSNVSNEHLQIDQNASILLEAVLELFTQYVMFDPNNVL
jgi:hypothetical protein